MWNTEINWPIPVPLGMVIKDLKRVIMSPYILWTLGQTNQILSLISGLAMVKFLFS